MAPKRSAPLDNPPAASSAEEEETSSSEEEEDEEGSGSSSEEEPQETLEAKKPESESESESGSESGSESEEEEKDVSPAKAKPLASKPMEETPTKSNKPKSKAASTKRVSEVDSDPKDSKRAKKKDSENGVAAAEKSEDTKKQLFQRLWSEEDEIILLRGIIDFSEKKGVDPFKDLSIFFDFIKKSVHFPATLSQLKDKLSRLRKKFENHAKGKQGEDKNFNKSHDQKIFDLSKKIWGVEGSVKPSKVKSESKTKKVLNSNGEDKSLAELKTERRTDEMKSETVDKMDVDKETVLGFGNVPVVGGIEQYVLRKGLEMLDSAKRAEIEEKWRKLHVAELELFVKRSELISEQAKLLLAAHKNK